MIDLCVRSAGNVWLIVYRLMELYDTDPSRYDSFGTIVYDNT